MIVIIQIQSSASSAKLRFVAIAKHIASCQSIRCEDSTILNRVCTIAFSRVFHACKYVTRSLACRGTETDSQRRRTTSCSNTIGKSSSGSTFSVAANKIPEARTRVRLRASCSAPEKI
jgi:hypothetical protein